MLYFALTRRHTRLFGSRRRFVVAVVAYDGDRAPPRLQYDGDYPSVDAVQLALGVWPQPLQGAQRAEVCYLLRDSRFQMRNQRIADFRINAAPVDGLLTEEPDVRIRYILLFAGGQ